MLKVALWTAAVVVAIGAVAAILEGAGVLVGLLAGIVVGGLITAAGRVGRRPE